MKKYVLIKLAEQSEFDYLVISLTFKSVASFTSQLVKEINENNVTLLFDTLVVNAQHSNRYASAKIENNDISLKSFQIVDASSLSLSIKKISYDFFETNKKALDYGVLSASRKDEFLNKPKNYI